MEYVALFALNVLLGLFPTGLPSSSVLGYFVVAEDMVVWEAVLVATVGITLGRVGLWYAARRSAQFVLRGPTARNLDWLGRYLESRRRTNLALFVAPIIPGSPASAIFASVGILRLALLPTLLGFIVSRLPWFSPIALGLQAADRRFESLDQIFHPAVAAPGLLVIATVFLVLFRVDWQASIAARRPRLLRGRGPSELGEPA